MKSLQKNISNPNPKILATWSLREANVIYAHCGYKSLGQPIVPDPKIKNYATAKDFSALAKELLSIQRYKGIRDLLGKTENERMVQFLQHEFGDFTSLEIWAAVDIAAAPDNPFELKYNGRVTDFTNDWLTSILRPYRNYRAGILQRYIDAEMVFEGGAPAQGKSEQELAKEELMVQRQLFFNAWQACKAGEPYAGLSRIYAIAAENLLYQYSDAEVMLAKKQAEDRMRQEGRTNSYVHSMHELLVKAVEAGKEHHKLEWQRILIRKLLKEDQRTIVDVLALIQKPVVFLVKNKTV